MQAVFVLALAAVANAQVFYNTPYAYTPYTFHHGMGYHAQSAGGVSHTVHKREAEAYNNWAYQPYAAMSYGHQQVYQPFSYYQPGVKGISMAGSYSNDAVSSFNYAGKGQYRAENAGTVHIAKREAEAEPQFYSHGMYPYTQYAATPMAYKSAVYAAPTAVFKPAVYAAPTAAYYQPAVYANTGMKTYSNVAASPFNYAAKGKYVADSLGARHVAKREAEPYVYSPYSAYGHSAYAYNPYRYSTLGYSNVYSPYRYSTGYHF